MVSKGLKILGSVIFLVGAITISYAQFVYDPTLSPMDIYSGNATIDSPINERISEINRLTDSYSRTIAGERIVNIERIQEQSRIFFFGIFLSVVGIILFVRGLGAKGASNTKAPNAVRSGRKFVGERQLSSDPYKIWLVETYDIRKNEALGSYICDQRIFESVELAINHAHEIENIAYECGKLVYSNRPHLKAPSVLISEDDAIRKLENLTRSDNFRNAMIFVLLGSIGLFLIFNFQ